MKGNDDTDNDAPPAIHQTPSNSNDVSPNCPFCTIATNFQPISPSDTSNVEWDPEKLAPPSYVLMSTEHVVAFLDIAPLTRGHVLVAPRKHRVKVGDMEGSEMSEVGRLLPILARTVMKTVLPDIPHEEADYNIVQNNGPGAAQVIPHVHFHIIPRPPLNYRPPPIQPASSSSSQPASSNSSNSTTRTYPRSKIPQGLRKSSIQFGRGQRHELDDDEAIVMVRTMRENLLSELPTSSSKPSTLPSAEGVSRTESNEPDGQGERYNGAFEGSATDAAWIEGGAGLVRNLERRGGLVVDDYDGAGEGGRRSGKRRGGDGRGGGKL